MLSVAPENHEKIKLAAWVKGIDRSALQEMLSVTSRQGITSFALGLPAPEFFPTEAFAGAVERALRMDYRALQYGPPFAPLKSHVTSLSAKRGVECKEQEVFLTTGAQQGMSLIARLLLNTGGQVLIEEYAYTGFQQVLLPYQPQRLTVPTDPATGIDTDAVQAILAAGNRPAFIYIVTEGHNPLGVSLSAEKRRRLAELSRHYNVPIIEDDAYGFLHYEGEPPAPIRALAPDHVFYIGSFSKILAPALRVGWMVVPERFIPMLSIIKEAADIDTCTFAQRSISAYLDDYSLDEHLNMLRREYRRRRDTMLSSMERHFPAEAQWQRPTSGVFIWVELPEEIDTNELLYTAVKSEQVAYIPGLAFCSKELSRSVNCMRLNFSNPGPDAIKAGIARLSRVLKGVPAYSSASRSSD